MNRLLGEDDRETLAVRGRLAQWRGKAGDPDRAIADLEDLLQDMTRVLGPNHLDTLVTRHNLAQWRGADPLTPAFPDAELNLLLGPVSQPGRRD